jgi:molybdenum cofactor biosynthesis enzyme MoaA
MTTKCTDAFKNLNIVSSAAGLEISPCCLVSTVKVDGIDFRNNQYLQNIRQDWNNGVFSSACGKCSAAESAGYTSRRQGVNRWYQDHNLDNNQVELTRIDYWVGDVCNLACAICGPHFSSVWKQELKLPIAEQKVKINQSWCDLDLATLRYVHFNGGEPLLSKEHAKFLEAVPNKSVVQINYNTNGTIRASAELQDLWKQFQLVQLDFSIDDVEDRFEYQRYPAKWNQVTDNLAWYIDTAPHNCMFAVNTSVGILNHANIDVLKSWLQKNFTVSRFTDPIEHRTQPTSGVFSLNNIEKRKSKIVATLDSLDQRRGSDWRATFPELINLLRP